MPFNHIFQTTPEYALKTLSFVQKYEICLLIWLRLISSCVYWPQFDKPKNYLKSILIRFW